MTENKKTNSELNSGFHLDVDAQVVRQLGAELITDAEQALLELVKNAYDADAKWCNLVIESGSEHKIQVPGTDTEVNLVGRICVEDAGSGMDKKALQDGWLTISLSPKRSMKEKGEVTPIFHRTPLGDKGLGRLGTMKLGDYLRITTHHDEDKKGYQIALLWSQCQSGRPLTQVPLSIEEIPKSGKKGTKIEIFGLSDPAYWSGEDRMNKLRYRLSTLVSPFKTFSNFTIGLTLNNGNVDLINFSDRLLNTATAQFECTWDDSELEMSGWVKMGLFEGKRREEFERYVLSDDGKSLFEFLDARNFSSGINLKKSKTKSCFLEFSQKRAWADVPIIQSDGLPIAKPGDFVAELYAFNLNFARESSDNLYNELGDAGPTLKELSGVYVFRDNFRVRASNDWLKLGEQWTSGGSYYGLKPKNTIGYFALTSKGNPRLLEKSDREGFIENAQYRGFYTLATELKTFANESLENLRRGYVDFVKWCKSKDLGFPDGMSAEDQAEQLVDLAKAARTIEATLKTSAKERTKALREVKTQISSLLEKQSPDAHSKREFITTLEVIEELVGKIDSENTEVQNIVGQVAEKEKLADVISERFEQLNTQISETYETVGIGLSAQGLIHELHPLLEEIVARAKRVKTQFERHNSRDLGVFSDLDMIRTIANLISRKMSFLDPMLRTFRETREDIDLFEFIKGFFELRKDRLERLNIKTSISGKEGDMSLRINRGRLTQVIDNLTRNSEYWLKDYSLKHKGLSLEIHAKLEGSKLVFFDTGPGVRPPLEKSIFDIFVTDKPKGQGHGLGLFIISQILMAEGCSIHLGSERNEAGRRFQFIVDFSGAIK